MAARFLEQIVCFTEVIGWWVVRTINMNVINTTSLIAAWHTFAHAPVGEGDDTVLK